MADVVNEKVHSLGTNTEARAVPHKVSLRKSAPSYKILRVSVSL